ncbi:MAG: hypothetical protein H0X24_17270, partial [Ktedonobacterales bacterium]|nr:hypothetical protein [Ktedonobacterales bacterium]
MRWHWLLLFVLLAPTGCAATTVVIPAATTTVSAPTATAGDLTTWDWANASYPDDCDGTSGALTAH